jgi:hypothetical protein
MIPCSENGKYPTHGGNVSFCLKAKEKGCPNVERKSESWALFTDH